MTFVFFALFVGVILIGKKIYKSYINPFSIFLGMFFLGFLLLFSSDFISYEYISGKMKTVYVISFICYTLGAMLSLSKTRRYVADDDVTQVSVEDKDFYKQEITVLFIIVLLSTLVYWAGCAKIYGTSGLFSNLLSTKETDNLNGLPNVVLYLKMVSIFLSPYVLYYIIIYKERKPYYWIIFVFTFLANIAYTRNTIIYIVILDLMVYAYSRQISNNRQSFKWVIYVFIVYVVFRFFSYTQVLFNKEFSVKGSVMGIAVSSAVLTVISYFAGPLVSASLYLEQIRNVPFLGYTLRNLIGVLNIFGAGIDTSAYQPDFWVMIPFRFNTASIQFYIMAEGGWIWLVVFFIFVGYIIDQIYWKYKTCYGKTRIMLLSFLSLVLILSVRGYLMNRLDMFIYLILLFVLNLLNSGKIKRYRVILNSHR